LEHQVAQNESGLSASDLQGLARSGEVATAEQPLPAWQQTGQVSKAYDSVGKVGQAPTSVTTALQPARFTEEVVGYECDHDLGLAAPGSAQWKIYAQSFLNSSQHLSVRDTVIATYADQLSAKGLDQPNLGAQPWAEETLEQAQPEQRQGRTAKAVRRLQARSTIPMTRAPLRPSMMVSIQSWCAKRSRQTPT
jgi:hypothetical protein